MSLLLHLIFLLSEFAKRLYVRAKQLNIEGVVNIIDDIPEDVEIIDEDD